MNSLLLTLVLLPFSLLAEEIIEKTKVRLLEISVTQEGVYAYKWDLPENPLEGVKRNQIYISGLRSELATGDTWVGYLIRQGAHQLKDGEKIPSYIVADEKQGEAQKSDKNISEAIFLVKTELSEGSGFAVNINNKSYFVTNLHVVNDSTPITIYNHQGKAVELPQQYEICNGKDIFRFEINNQCALDRKTDVTMGESVTAYGNSGGQNIITELPGAVLGIGPNEIELSCGIIHGNSGGPVLDKKNKVIGIASFLRSNDDSAAIGTRFEKIRRFAIRINDSDKWTAISQKVFEKEIKPLAAMDDALGQISALVSNYGSKEIAREPLAKGLSEKSSAQLKVNVGIDFYNKKIEKVSYTQSEDSKIKKQKAHLFFTMMADACEALIKDTATFWESDYSKKRFEELSQRANELAKDIRTKREQVVRTL
jgi:hypothetical protein